MPEERHFMPTEKANLLIVEDEPSTRESLSGIFSEFGYGVRSAENGFSALVEIRNNSPDIILSDLNMPGMSGFELLSVVPPPISRDSGHRHERSVCRHGYAARGRRRCFL